MLWAVLSVVGLIMALVGVLEPRTTVTAGPEVVAQVGERFLTRDDLARLLDAERGQRRGETSVEEASELLQALIDEELLIQRAEVLGLVDTDPTLRRALQAAQKEHVAPFLERRAEVQGKVERAQEPSVGGGPEAGDELLDGHPLFEPENPLSRERKRLKRLREKELEEYVGTLRQRIEVRVVAGALERTVPAAAPVQSSEEPSETGATP